MNPLDDIRTPRLILRHMSDEVMAACLRGELGRAERVLGIRIPAELLDRPTSLQYGLARWADDCRYEPWSMRAVVLPRESAMIGHIRFHSSPDPEYLRRYAPGAVEFGYCIFRDYRRHGYATEAAMAVMEWAQESFGVRHFIASVSPGNHPSLRLIGRLGFVHVGTELDDTDGVEHVFLRVASAPASAGGSSPA